LCLRSRCWQPHVGAGTQDHHQCQCHHRRPRRDQRRSLFQPAPRLWGIERSIQPNSMWQWGRPSRGRTPIPLLTRLRRMAQDGTRERCSRERSSRRRSRMPGRSVITARSIRTWSGRLSSARRGLPQRAPRPQRRRLAARNGYSSRSQRAILCVLARGDRRNTIRRCGLTSSVIAAPAR